MKLLNACLLSTFLFSASSFCSHQNSDAKQNQKYFYPYPNQPIKYPFIHNSSDCDGHELNPLSEEQVDEWHPILNKEMEKIRWNLSAIATVAKHNGKNEKAECFKLAQDIMLANEHNLRRKEMHQQQNMRQHMRWIHHRHQQEIASLKSQLQKAQAQLAAATSAQTLPASDTTKSKKRVRVEETATPSAR